MSANAIERLREKADLFVIPGFRDDDGVWHDGPHRVEFDAALAAVEELLEAAKAGEQALVDLHESLFIGSERRVSPETLAEMAKFAKAAALALAAAVRRVESGQ